MKKYNIPIFVPHSGCPFDCVFCNQRRITGHIKPTTPNEVTEIIERHLSTIPRGSEIEAAFFGGSFTGIPIEEQSSLLYRAAAYIQSGKINGIRLSTRPDYIDAAILDNLKKYGVTTIELGVQSMSDAVLKAADRGHTAERAKEAAGLIKEYGFRLGLQMMTGLPGDCDKGAIETAKEIIALKPDCVRIYPTLVIKDTRLMDMYLSGEYTPQTVEDAARLCARLLRMFEEADIKVIRIGLQPTDEINPSAAVAAGPFHSAFGEVVESRIYYDLAAKALKGIEGEAVIYVNPSEISKMTAHRRENIKKLKDELNISVKIKDDKNLNKREVRAVAAEKT